MAVTCGHCAHLNLKTSPLGPRGFGICKASREPWRMPSISFPRECDRFTQADAATIQRRRDALAPRPATKGQPA